MQRVLAKLLRTKDPIGMDLFMQQGSLPKDTVGECTTKAICLVLPGLYQLLGLDTTAFDRDNVIY